MKNFIADGDNVTVAAPASGTTSGNGYLITGIFGIAATTQLVGEDVVLVTEGVFNITKVGSQAWSVGDRIYWDDTNARCTTDAGAGPYIGTCVEAVGSGAGLTTGKVRLNGLTPSATGGSVNATAATLTVTAALHSGRVVTLNRAAGQAVTLPASAGTGDVYRFFVGTTVTSNSTTIKVANSSDIMAGTAIQAADAGSTSNMWETGASDDTITFNGTTTGGIKGDYVELIDVSTNVWFVRVTGSATGTEATPFSATV